MMVIIVGCGSQKNIEERCEWGPVVLFEMFFNNLSCSPLCLLVIWYVTFIVDAVEIHNEMEILEERLVSLSCAARSFS